MISPTIGRVVIVQRGKPEAQPSGWPALVNAVHSDRLINAAGFDEHGSHVSFQSITLLQDDDTPPETGPYAEWMPYQKQAAAKAAADTPPPAEPSGPVSA